MMRQSLRLAAGLLAMLGMVVLGYPVAAWVGSSIPQNSEWSEPENGVDIMVETNGTHTSIIVPVVTAQKDWRETFPSASAPTPHGPATHIAIGYGEREVFLNVPTWGDLQPGTALRIATVGGDALVRVSHYVRPAPSENHRPLRITHDQYARLVSAIEAHLPEMPVGDREVLKGTYVDDAYYEALGDYTMGTTCNSWVGARLADAGIPMGLWTPMAGGVMKWIPDPDSPEAN
ncbi:DUF2459 domain-containing protein [Aurantiacibacter sp. D1-12]|uniref:DUF2459 domain-containing protein n=1 Tax=Aurantiacibacter sp. D1-12 TaxID=2993658 RepID=UPI00237CEEA2|nr:DUF2459 domain-containing protein [Aurantiacibacter sp. D1-12]MDE1468308.1 DUF2459 domain-containing protein [Aurantiacibacter sp. D1-12]